MKNVYEIYTIYKRAVKFCSACSLRASPWQPPAAANGGSASRETGTSGRKTDTCGRKGLALAREFAQLSREPPCALLGPRDGASDRFILSRHTVVDKIKRSVA